MKANAIAMNNNPKTIEKVRSRGAVSPPRSRNTPRIPTTTAPTITTNGLTLAAAFAMKGVRGQPFRPVDLPGQVLVDP
jgi:hypothetical protein